MKIYFIITVFTDYSESVRVSTKEEYWSIMQDELKKPNVDFVRVVATLCEDVETEYAEKEYDRDG